jgi:hypothetical protein
VTVSGPGRCHTRPPAHASVPKPGLLRSELWTRARTPAHVESGPIHFRNDLLREETERICIVKPNDDEVACTSVNQRPVVRHCTLRVAVKNEVLTKRGAEVLLAGPHTLAELENSAEVGPQHRIVRPTHGLAVPSQRGVLAADVIQCPGAAYGVACAKVRGVGVLGDLAQRDLLAAARHQDRDTRFLGRTGADHSTVRPRGRDCQSMDPAQCLRVGDRISVWIDVLKVVWRSEPADARLVVVDVVQASLGRRGGAQTGVLSFWGPRFGYTSSVA